MGRHSAAQILAIAGHDSVHYAAIVGVFSCYLQRMRMSYVHIGDLGCARRVELQSTWNNLGRNEVPNSDHV